MQISLHFYYKKYDCLFNVLFFWVAAAALLRHGCLQEWIKKFEESEGGIENFTKGYDYYGIHVLEDNSVVAREWAPGALAVYLTGTYSEF